MKTNPRLHFPFSNGNSLPLLMAGFGALFYAPDVQAQFYAGRFNAPGAGYFEGEDGLRTSPIAAGGYYDAANWQDSGGTGAPNDFGADYPIPGDIINQDENDWGIVGSGILHVNTTGTYVFRTGTDDASHTILNGRNVAVQQGCCANADGPGIFLNAGTSHFLQVLVKEGGGGGNGEFSVSRDGGPFVLLGTGTSGDFNVNQTGFVPAVTAGTAPGLAGRYFNTASPTLSNQNRDLDSFLLTNPTPTGTFTSTTINYTASGTINDHLGSDASSLTAGGGNSTENALFLLDGYIRIDLTDDLDATAAGIQVKFAFDADDNARLSIGDFTIIENDGGHGTGHWVSANTDTLASGTGDNAGGTALLTFPTAGDYDLSASYHNGGGPGAGRLLSSIGLGNGDVQIVPGDRFFSIPEPTSAALAGLTLLLAGRRARRR